MVEGKPIYCHQVILASRSVYFEASFSHEFTEKEQRVATYNDVPYDFFMIFLRHIYSDSVKVETKYIYELLSVSYTSHLNSLFSLARRSFQCQLIQEKVRTNPCSAHQRRKCLLDLQVCKHFQLQKIEGDLPSLH